MDKYKKMTFILLLIQFILILSIAFFFKVDDMTLGQGDIYSFDSGWTLIYPDGSKEEVESLPYHSVSYANDIVIAKNKIDKEYFGKTLFFLTADKELVIRMDGKEIYTFGKNNQRLFGHTPGSVYNFVDIPVDASEGLIEIEMVSAYDNYATYLSNFRIAKRDVAIIKVLRENMFNILCCVIQAFSGFILLILGLLQHYSKKNDQGMMYLGVLLSLAAMYYLIETKMLHLVYGNQTVYSYMIFLFLMVLPILLNLYYMQMNIQDETNSFRFVLILAFCNMIIQIVLQVLNIKDLMDMAFLSHTLIFMTILVVLIHYMKMAKRKDVAWLEMGAILIIASGSIFDLYRTYTICVGDLGKYSRYATTLYGLIMIFKHIRQIVKDETEEIEANERYLEQEVERKTEQIRSMLLQTIDALSNAVDAKDYYTNGHSKRVADYSKMIAEKLGMSAQEQSEIYFAGLMHDIGKIRIPDEIIKKEDKLTDEEFDYIKLHPVSGYHILKGISALNMVADGAKYHHERYDGRGYPNHLSGENIPFAAQIIGVADAYDAMTSNRCYRGALRQDVVRKEIENGKGTQFNPKIADIMLQIIDEDKEYNLKQSELQQKNILLIADDFMQKTIHDLITKENAMYRVIGCKDVKQAKEIISTQSIQLVLIDAEFVDKDEYESLQSEQESFDIHTIYITSSISSDILHKFETRQADDYLTKPVSELELNEIVHSILKN